MEKEFVPYEIALQLKELGFDEPCLAFYNGKFLDLGVWDWEYSFGEKRRDIGECPQAPTFSQTFRWFREKYKLHIEIRSYTARFFTIVIQECKDIVKYIEYGGINLKFNTYEEAELVCLEKLIEIIKENGK